MNDIFRVDYLDHVALRVRDIGLSAEWYQKVLGLKKYSPEEWGDFPVFLLAGKSGIALFPLKDQASQSSNPNYDHFAFHVDNKNFKKAQKRLARLNIEFDFQDYHYFHSIYFRDPDENKVELTTIVVNTDEFYI